MPSVELSNKALSDATSKIMQVMARAVRLKDGHPDHLKLAVEIGMIMVDIPLSVVSCADCKQSPSFEQYGMSATVVPLVFLSAAMEMLEHMDPMRQHFAIPSDITKYTAANAGGTGNPVDAAATELSRAKPKAKPLPRKKKPEQLHLDGDGIEMVPGGEDDNVQKDADTGMGKGKGKEVALPENVQEVDAELGQVPAMEKRRLGLKSKSTTSACTGAQQPPVGIPCIAVKNFKEAQSCSVATNTPSESCRQKISMLGGLAVLARRHADILLLKICLFKAILMPELRHCIPVLPIATLSPEPDSPSPAKPSLSPVLDPPRQSPAPTTQESMDVSGDAIVGELRAMTLEVLNDSATLSARKSDLQKVTDGLRAEVDRLQACHIVTQEVVMTLQQRIAAQDAKLHGLQGLRTELAAPQKTSKLCRDLKNAQEQLTRQERTTGVLQDTYNSLCHCVLGANQSVSPPFSNTVYLATPCGPDASHGGLVLQLRRVNHLEEMSPAVLVSMLHYTVPLLVPLFVTLPVVLEMPSSMVIFDLLSSMVQYMELDLR
ncbi:hypothetical protein F4604DRAFT_1673519 [Suillus subluteus]|nr:hypothetical protein F4604DRAFT_1673519 [Suillus subluteus]